MGISCKDVGNLQTLKKKAKEINNFIVNELGFNFFSTLKTENPDYTKDPNFDPEKAKKDPHFGEASFNKNYNDSYNKINPKYIIIPSAKYWPKHDAMLDKAYGDFVISTKDNHIMTRFNLKTTPYETNGKIYLAGSIPTDDNLFGNIHAYDALNYQSYVNNLKKFDFLKQDNNYIRYNADYNFYLCADKYQQKLYIVPAVTYYLAITYILNIGDLEYIDIQDLLYYELAFELK